MKPALVDTDILSMYFRGNDTVKINIDRHIEEYGTVNLSIITYYEILSGLKHRDARKQLDSFLGFAAQNTVLSLTDKSVMASAEIYAKLRTKGDPIDDIDILTASIALSNGLALATNNENHFKRINQLEIVNWSKRKF